MQPKHPLLQKTVKQLEALPNFQARVEAMPYMTPWVLAYGQLIVENSDRRVEYICEIRSDVTSETVELTIEYLIQLQHRLNDGQRSLLITQNLSDPVIEQLLEQNIEFVDTAGDLYLNSPGIYALVRRQRHLEVGSKSSEITSTSLQIIYSLLQDLKNLGSSNFESTLAEFQGIPSSTVKNELEKLARLGYLQHRRNRYYIVDYIKLLERWEMGYVESLRPKLLINTFTPIGQRTFSEVADDITQHAKEYGYLIGGELGAAIATDYLRSTTTTLHVPEEYRSIFVKLKLKPSPKGEISFVRQFGMSNAWNNNRFSILADPLLVHAELQMIHDDRVRETANRLFDEYIAPRANDVGV
ncbi:MAG: hypothetical protein KME13_23060 [Myxacorys californica WJT36-NPBG1]|jgi:hypothetical protein|nr:hypothetical protein [Myxacorys californica WJT36-NPBG1]